MGKNDHKKLSVDLRYGLDLLTDLNRVKIKAENFSASDQNPYIDACSDLHQKCKKWTIARKTQGLGIGEKTSNGRPTGQLCIKVYVDKKRPKSKLKNIIPKQIQLPDSRILITDVEEIGRVEMESFTTRTRPVMPGCGLGHVNTNAGTLGCVVVNKNDPNKIYVLSNSHVLAQSGKANIGDKIIQPSKLDNGKVTTDTIAKLSDFEPFDYSTGYPNLIDAAIAKKVPGVTLVPDIRSLDFAPIGVSKTLRRDMKVQKVGRTSDLTVGIIRDIDHRTRFPYNLPDGSRKTVGFRDVVFCSRFTSGGDSGSAVLNMSKRIVGLHFAGSPAGSIFCKISNVFKLLEIKLP